jgi:hypothetical protein
MLVALVAVPLLSASSVVDSQKAELALAVERERRDHTPAVDSAVPTPTAGAPPAYTPRATPPSTRPEATLEPGATGIGWSGDGRVDAARPYPSGNTVDTSPSPSWPEAEASTSPAPSPSPSPTSTTPVEEEERPVLVFHDAWSSVPGGPIYQPDAGCGPTHATLTVVVENAGSVEVEFEIVWPTDNKVYGSGSAGFMTQIQPDRFELVVGDFVVEPPSTVIDFIFRFYDEDGVYRGWHRLNPPMTLNDGTFCP